MNADTCVSEIRHEDEKNGTKTGQNGKRNEELNTLSETSIDFWKKRVCFRPGVARKLYYVRLRQGGRDAWICLNTAERGEAAKLARKRWEKMKVIGLEALLKELAPVVTKRASTIADAIEAARTLATVRPTSFAGYAQKLRTIAGKIAGIAKPANATSRNDPAAIAWRKAVGAVRLSVLTKEAVADWRKQRVDAAGGNPLKRRSAEISADSTVRMARSVFSKKNVKAGMRKLIELPPELPFAGVSCEESFIKFRCKVEPSKLFADAQAELESQHPEQFLAFCLCLFAALRRSEVDLLRWDQVNIRQGTITIETTEHKGPKTADSDRVVSVAPAVVNILKRAIEGEPDPVFVLRGATPKPQKGASPVYRGDAAPYRTWERLIAWLRGKGIANRTPIHALRGLAATYVNKRFGLNAASALLGHADIRTTANSYLATSEGVFVDFSEAPLPAANVSAVVATVTTESAAPAALTAGTKLRLKLRTPTPLPAEDAS